MHLKQQVILFFRKYFSIVKETNGGENISIACFCCPIEKRKPGKYKLVIHTPTFKAHCWTCSVKTRNIYFLLRKHHSHIAEEFKKRFSNSEFISFDDQVEDKTPSLDFPYDFELISERYHKIPKDNPLRHSLAYLKSRSISYEDLWKYKIGLSREEYKERIIIPSFDSEGNCNFYTTRAYKHNINPSYKNADFPKETIIFNELYINWNKPLILVEGPFDYFKIIGNKGCLLGKELTKDYILFDKIVENNTPIILALDNDAKNTQYKIAKYLNSYGINVSILSLPEKYKDFGELKKPIDPLVECSIIPYTEEEFVRFKLNQ